MKTETSPAFRLEDYRPFDFVVRSVALRFRLDAGATRVHSRLLLERRAGSDPAAPLCLDGDGLSLSALTIDGRPAGAGTYRVTPDSLRIDGLPSSGAFAIEIETVIDPSANKALMGLYRSSGIYCTQCEAEGFRRITYFPDRPDVLSVYAVRIEARRGEAPLLLSNGNPVAAGDLGDGWHFAEWHDPHPKPSYLFALVAGDLERVGDHFATASGRRVELGIFVEHGKGARAAYAMDALKRSMAWDEQAFGREYDLDVFNIVAVSDFNMGAMENKGLNVFNDKYILADAETATDADYANIEAIVAHEYFHNWTGNRITCRDWFQLCLKEGLTVFRDHEFSADMRSRGVKRVAEVRTLKAHQFPEDQGPLAHPVRPRRYREINNFYTATVYEKGSELVRMLRTLLGAAAFRAGMDLYFSRHDGQAVTIEDFLACFAEASGQDLGQFSTWYHQAGTPNLNVSAHYSAREKTFRLEIEQSTPPTPGETRKKLLHMPLAFGLIGANGKDATWTSVDGAKVSDGVIHLRKRRHSVTFHGVGARPVASLNRGFSAPVTLHFEQGDADRRFLARHDSDSFGRWQAANELLTRSLIAAAKAQRGGKGRPLDPELAAIIGDIAVEDSLEPAFRALVLQLPSEADIAREMGTNIDPDAILSSRNAHVSAIGAANAARFAAALDAARIQGPFNPDARDAGNRALGLALLDFLVAAEGSPDRAARLHSAATNMTESAGALSILCTRFPDSPATKEALAGFRRRHADNPLVLDKWFALQAVMPGPGALARIRDLMGDDAFALANPNRVRALIGTFAGGNATGFNRADGEAYRFLMQAVTEIDGFNPQVAARLATAMRSWRQLEPVRREHARAAIAEAAGRPGLSRDLADILHRTLA
ncbi:MAG: aminopeptidase N [Rhizobiaceae bacterium]